MSYPVISIVLPRQLMMFSVGLCRPGKFWGDSGLFIERCYLINLSFSRSIGARAITLIIGPLYLQFGWRVQ